MSPVHLNRRREPPSLSDTRNENSCVSDMPIHTFKQSSEHTMSTFPRLRRVKEKSKVSSAAFFVQNIESLPKCDLYFSDPDAKAKEARMSYATSGGEIKPSFSQQYSASYQDCISTDKRSISSQLLLLDDKDEVFRKIDNNEEHFKENIGFLASNKSPETSQSHFAQSHSATNSFCHINHERANLQACTNEVTIKYSKNEENVKTTPGSGDTGKVKITSPRTAPAPLKTPELSKTEPTVEGLPRTPIVGAENNNLFSSDVPLEGQVHTDIYEETLEAQGDSVNQLTNRPNTRLLPSDCHVGSAQALSGKSREKIDHRLSRRTQIEPLGPVHRLRRSLSRSRRRAALQTADDVPSATFKKTIGCRIKNVGRKATKQPIPNDTKDTKNKFFGFSRNRRALKPRRTTELPNGAPKSSLSGNAVALNSDSEGEYDDYWDVEENLTLKEAVLTTCLEAGYFFHALGAWVAEETMVAIGLIEHEDIAERISPDNTLTITKAVNIK